METLHAPALGRAIHKRQFNDAVRRLHDGPGTQAIGFVCECVSSGCFATVWLTEADYDTRRVHPGWEALATGHDGYGAIRRHSAESRPFIRTG